MAEIFSIVLPNGEEFDIKDSKALRSDDIADWAKADEKPTYTADEVGAATEEYVDDAIDALPSPMIFKGSLGAGGTIVTLPDASADNEGYTYKVITDGTYGTQSAKVGDVFISNGNEWIYIPSADEPSGTVTSVGMTVPTGLEVSGSPITSSGTLAVTMADGYSIPTTAKQTEWDSKQDALTDTQMSAVNSGITADKVATYDGYADEIAKKADKSEIPVIPESLPANGGNADTVGRYTPSQLIQSNPNLLINPDFRINQRGANGDQADWTYFVDRWKGFGHSIQTPSDGRGGIIVSVRSDNTYASIMQSLESDTAPNDEYVTFSTNVDGVIYSTTGFISSTKALVMYCDGFRVEIVPTLVQFYFIDTSKNYEILWTKLELGETATTFVPPDPATELLKCQRYYEVVDILHDIAFGHAYYGDTKHFMLTYKMHPKHRQPHLTFDDLTGIYIHGSGINNISTVISANAEVVFNKTDVIYVQLTAYSDLSTQICYLNENVNRKIYLDAEIY